MATFDTKRNLADQMEFNKQFFSPEAISARLEAKANIAANADVRKAEKMLPIQSKLYGQTELKKQELENRGYETAMNIKNVPDLEELKWKKSPKFFRQELSKVSMANAPESERNKLLREKWDFEKSMYEGGKKKRDGSDPFARYAPSLDQEQEGAAKPGTGDRYQTVIDEAKKKFQQDVSGDTSTGRRLDLYGLTEEERRKAQGMGKPISTLY